MNLSEFFETQEWSASDHSPQMTLSVIPNIELKDLQSGDLIFLSAGKGQFSKPREKLAELFAIPASPKGRVIDLGHLKAGLDETLSTDILERIAETIKELDAAALLLCNEEAFIQPWFMALKRFRKQAELSVISSRFTLMPVYQDLLSLPFMHKLHCLGVQHSLCEPELRSSEQHPRLHQIRLGALRKELLQAEPVLRNSDMLVFNTNAIRFADFQASGNVIPNGFFSEEACALARYAGFSDRMALGMVGPYFYEADEHGNNAALLAQIIWHFMDGWAARCSDHPDLHEDFISYRCELTHERLSLLFFKSRLTERWWMEIPDVDSERVLIPCTYSDYNTAASGETPELFFRAIRNL